MSGPNTLHWNIRAPALAVAALLQLAAVWVLINALQVQKPVQEMATSQTAITFLPYVPPPDIKKHKSRPGRGSAPSADYFRPNSLSLQTLSGAGPERLSFVLSSCDMDHYDMQSFEIRSACDRIGALVKADPGHLGIVSEVKDYRHWQVELARREAPYLAPCMSPAGLDVLYTLNCIYDVIFTGYREEERRRYSDMPSSAPRLAQ